MNWNLDNLAPEQEKAISRRGYIGAFWRVLMPRLLATEPPKTEPVVPASSPDIDAQPRNTYIPLVHQMTHSERLGDFWTIWRKWNAKKPHTTWDYR
jgi:hypothetical protein